MPGELLEEFLLGELFFYYEDADFLEGGEEELDTLRIYTFFTFEGFPEGGRVDFLWSLFF